MKTVGIIQARMGSTRLPGKVLKILQGRPMIWHIVDRLSAAAGMDGVVVATSTSAGDEPLRNFCREAGIQCFAGSEEDVLERYVQAAESVQAERVVRVTGDCPCVDPEIIGQLISLCDERQLPYAGIRINVNTCTDGRGRFPDGLDGECMDLSLLQTACREATRSDHREHVTPFIWQQPQRFRCGQLTRDIDVPDIRLTVDHADDFELISRIYEACWQPDHHFGLDDILATLHDHPQWLELNHDRIGHEKYRALLRSVQIPDGRASA